MSLLSSSTKQKSSFTSYVDYDIKTAPNINGCGDSGEHDKPKPKLLQGEAVATSAEAEMYSPTTKITDNSDGILGLLVVTNFKLSFLPYEQIEAQGSYQENTFLGNYDVTLSNIDVLYQVTDRKRRKILPKEKISSKIEALHIVCKNFRLLKFSFKKAAKDQGKLIASALALFAFPSRQDLSFAYYFKENYYNTLKSTVTMFNTKSDWTRELIRCGATDWRVISSESLDLPTTQSLPLHFVIPKSFPIDKYVTGLKSFADYRSAIWAFSYNDASLLRMAELKPDVLDTSIENVTLETIRKCAPKKMLHLMNLNLLLPSIQDVQKGYIKFRDLCTPENPRQFLMQDSKFYSLLDKSCWLFYVSLCIKHAVEAAEKLRENKTVVLRENNARDMCCIISSLVQLILDPHFRTIDGFQSLIQKEWVAMEHPFATRLGHTNMADSDDEKSPILLLFLDCVWQLLNQFPSEFEFSQTFLTTIWDSAFIPIFDTFQFNTEAERYHATKQLKLILRPVWDWNEQFSEKDKIFFSNPFYVKKQDNCRKSIAIPPNAVLLPGFQKPSRFTMDPSQLNQSSIPKDKYLEPKWKLLNLEIWEQCYYRWIPLLEIKGGGFPQIDLLHRLILSNISKLQRAIETGDYDDLPDNATTSNDATPTNSPARNMPKINSFFPFSVNLSDSSQLTDILTSSNELLTDGSIMERLSIAQLPD